ncbi:MAG: iron-sulfur cluster repair di-iron protein [Cytophagales bacterium]|nr:iron-sulfur cluster repair di-iron protein [Cytophagales bacterium]
MLFSEKTINELINTHPEIASALRFLGIHFDNYSEHTLSQLCHEKGLNPDMVVSRIHEHLYTKPKQGIIFSELPIDLLIAYLKHNHYLFIKQRLPFLMELVNKFDIENEQIKAELKFVMPLFVEDFIEHIYEEEDTFFVYILYLYQLLNNNTVENTETINIDRIRKYYEEHTTMHDDVLKGLRELTHNFEIDASYDINTKVVLSELKRLDQDLLFHAKVENEILFPRAIALETDVKLRMSNLLFTQ